MIKGWRKHSSKKHDKHDNHEKHEKHKKHEKHDKSCAEHDKIKGMSSQERHQYYMKRAEDGWNHAWDIYHSDGWKLSAGKDHHTGCVYTKHCKEGGKIFKLDGFVDATPEDVFYQLVHGDNESPTWNPTVLMCKTLQKLNSNTDIAYNISAPGAGGLVSSRDFVNLRHWKTKNNLTMSLGLSVCHPDMPPTHKYVRAENNPAAWGFKEVDGGKCFFTLILKTDLKGWIPHYLVDQAMTGCLVNYIKYLRDRMHNLKNPGCAKPVHAAMDLHSIPHIGNNTITNEQTEKPYCELKDNEESDENCDESDDDSVDFQSCEGDSDIAERLEELDLDETSVVSR